MANAVDAVFCIVDPSIPWKFQGPKQQKIVVQLLVCRMQQYGEGYFHLERRSSCERNLQSRIRIPPAGVILPYLNAENFIVTKVPLFFPFVLVE